MKNIKLFIACLSTVAVSIVSCEDNGDKLTGNQNVGGLINPTKKLIGYVIGNGDSFEYNNTIKIDQSQDVKVVKINIYKYFVDTKGTLNTADDKISNENFLKSIDVNTDNQDVTVPYSVTYPQLIAGLTVNGAPLPTNDTGLFIGDYFLLRYEQVRSDGELVQSPRIPNFTTKVAVGTRLAGAYKTIEAVYYRIGVLTSTATGWPSEIIIESVNATTYKLVGSMGFFPPTPTDPNNILFLVNGTNITYSPLQLTGNGQPFITCSSSPVSFNPEVNCGTSNKVVLDNVNGKDKLYMTFGYLSPSGPRVFYQVLEKIVE